LVRLWAAAITITFTVVACAAPAPQLPSMTAMQPQLGIDNRTELVVTLVVNGTVIETVRPSTRQDPVVASLPPLPWSVEARSPTNRVLLALTVHPGDVAAGQGGGVTGAQGRLASVDLSCGRLDLWSGPAPVGEPTFIPGPSGDCQ
jgi:hypothetical protein